MIKNEILQMMEIDDLDGKYGEYSPGVDLAQLPKYIKPATPAPIPEVSETHPE